MKRRLLLQGLVLAAAVPLPARAAAGTAIDVYKSPTCGCCVEWGKHLEANGFSVRYHETGNTAARSRLGIPLSMGSCHTAEVGGYAVEGHVPAREIRRLLSERPAARGLAVPGMPVGSPGMEQGDRRDAYDVLLVLRDGGSRVYASYPAGGRAR
ncbi:MAG: DUF411 domain-containing protein [Burkholderiales bacterium]|jgi:hypothetical protein|nr:DUF411 domain-containing protein [Burkholderiales bacterium]